MTGLAFLNPSPVLQTKLVDFYRELESSGATRYFRPHPMDEDEAQRRIDYRGSDYYVLAVCDDVRGYGFLRWYVGFERPSLGIAVLPRYQGTGLGRALMEVMHAEARRRECREVRLRVHPENARARGLYESLGYVWRPELARGELEGIRALGKDRSTEPTGSSSS